MAVVLMKFFIHLVFYFMILAEAWAFPGTGRAYIPSSTPTPPPSSDGYFVLSSATYTGSMGGIAGANTSCYNEVTGNDWLGKSSAGTITTARVKAFLCTTTACNNLQPNTVYKFASAATPSDGGASFTSDASGLGPGNADKWWQTTYLGTAGSDIWSGRAAGGSTTTWPNTPYADTASNAFCTNWTSDNSSRGGVVATTNATGATRWSWATVPCNTLGRRLICIVDP